MHLSVVGLNHKTASVSVREKVAFSPEKAERALLSLSSQDCVTESLILSTCNRTEIYVVFKPGCYDPDLIRNFVSDINNVCCDEINPHLYEMSNAGVVEHLYRVVSGLDSMVVGENQIAAQAKEAYRIATTVKATGPILNRLFHTAFRVSKKIRTQTGIGAGSLSVSQAACDLAEKIFRRLAERSVLLIGAGENGELTARSLKDRGVGKLLITNRTFEKARALADKLNAEAVDFNQLTDALSRVDIVISSTGAQGTVVDYSHVKAALAKRQLPLFMIDLAIPRDIDPLVDQIDNVFLYDMDSLQQEVNKSLQRRSDEAHKAKSIAADEARKFLNWQNGQKATPTILEMQQRFDHLRMSELEKIREKLDPEQFELVDLTTRAIMNKVLHTPISTLRNAAQKGDEKGLIKVLRSALGLGEETP